MKIFCKNHNSAPMLKVASIGKIQKSILSVIFLLSFVFHWNNVAALCEWVQKANFGPGARYSAVGFSIGTKGYVGTGYNAGVSYKDFWEYNPATNIWTQKANFGGTARYGAVGFSIGNKGYLGTGGYPTFTKDFWEYDPSTNLWTQKANFGGAARYIAIGFSINNKGYIGTGYNPTFLKDFWEYDPGTDTWTQRADFAGAARVSALSIGFRIGSKGYAGTGAVTETVSKKDFWEYDQNTNVWTQKADLTGSERYAAVGFAVGTKGYIGTGYNGVTATRFNDFWEYNPATNTWAQVASYGGTARYGATAFVVGNTAYVGTGADVSGYRNDFWAFDPTCSLALSITQTNVTCYGGSNGSATLTINGGTSPYTFSWSTSPVQTTQTATGLTAATYSVTVTDANNCTKCQSVTITQPAQIILTTSQTNVSCSGGNDGSATVAVTGGTPTYSYLWSNGQTTSSATGLAAATYTVTVNDANNCTKTANVTITQPPTLVASAGADASICSGQSTTLSASATGGTSPYSFLWSNGANTASISVSPATTTVFTITMTDNNGCKNTDNVQVTINPLPVASITPSGATTFCQGESVTLTSSGATSYLWSNSATTQSITVFSSGNYSVTVTDANGCTNSASQNITVNTLPIADAGNDVTIFAGQSVQIGSAPVAGNTYSWSPTTGLNDANISNPAASPTVTTTYTLTVDDINGCISTDGVTVIFGGLLIDGEFTKTILMDTVVNIFDRFGNTYSLDEIKINGPLNPLVSSCTAGIFQLDFTGNDFASNSSAAVAMRDVFCQVMKDISALITPAQCNGVNPIVYLEITSDVSGLPACTCSTGCALMAATSYYTDCGPGDITGIVDGDVWKAINTGVNEPNIPDGKIYVRFDLSGIDACTPGTGVGWYFTLTGTPSPASNEFDAYSVILHETIHALGFASLIGANGQSKQQVSGKQHYSRFDTFLRSNSANANLINWNGCYVADFNAPNVSVADLTSGCANIVFNGTNTGIQPIYAPCLPQPGGGCGFSDGSSLSHFDGINCSGVNYVMNPAIPASTVRRVPSSPDVSVLCDLGYHTTGTFGDGTLPFHTSYTNAILPSCGERVAGVNDGYPISCGATQYIVEACSTITINPLINDIPANCTLSCVTISSGAGTIPPASITTTNFLFDPQNTPGITTITYIPVGPSPNFQKGNITCIRIIVTACGSTTCATPANCNQVCNPDFATPGSIMFSHGNPSYGAGTVGNPNPGFVGMWASHTSGYNMSEGVLFQVDVQPNTPYIFSYYRAWGSSTNPVPVNNANVRLIQSNNSPGIGTGAGSTIPPVPSPSFLVLQETNINNSTWEQVVVCFKTPITPNVNYDWLWIYPEQNPGSGLTWFMIDQVELIEDNFTAGADKNFICPGIDIGTNVCNITNTTYQWTVNAGDANSIIGSVNQPITQVAPDITTTYQLQRSFPPFPTNSTITTPLLQNCITTDLVTITVSAPLILTITTTNTGCNNNIGTATANISGGTTPYLYEWDINGTIFITPAVSGLAAGIYSVTITDANGCSASVGFTISAIGTVPITGNLTFCQGASTTLTALAGFTSYSWSNGQTTASITVTTAGTYSVTATSPNCTANSSVVVTVNPKPTINAASPVNPICQGTSIPLTVSASGGTSPYSFNWSPVSGLTCTNCSNTTATPSVTTTYTITVTDANNCTSSNPGTISVTVTMPPVANFTFNEFDNCEDHGVNFINTTPTGTATSYHWDFDDGSTSGATSPVHSFAFPGYYRVKLTAFNGTCSNSISKDIYITPSTPTYNPSMGSVCCINNFTGFALTHITVPTTSWTGLDINIKGTLTVPAGVTFTVDGGTILHFGPQGRIVVEAGGTLILGVSELTSINYSCGNLMWMGIEVRGNTSSSSPTAQGRVLIQSSSGQGKSIIKYAHNAVTLGQWQLLPVSGGGYKYYWHLPSAGGGIFQNVSNTESFENNAVGLRFWEYPFSNTSIVTQNNFKCIGTLLDPYYNITNSTANYSLSQIKKHNPFFAVPDGNTTGRSIYSIYQRQVKNITFRDNNFDNVETAMLSIDAKYDVATITGGAGSRFTNVKIGIDISGALSAYYGHKISDNFFRNFNNGISISGGKGDVIRDNSFNTGANSTSQSNNIRGISLFSTQQFTVIDNSFNKILFGILSNNSGNTVSSIIGRQKTGSNAGNVFTRNYVGIQTQSINSMLNIRCNQHENQGISGEYSTSWRMTGALPPSQGQSGTDKKKPAGSRFQYLNNFPQSVQQLKEIKSNQNFVYEKHRITDQNSPLTTQLNDEYYPIPIGVSIHGNNVDCPASDFPCCLPVLSGCNPCNKTAMTQYSTQITQLEAEFISVQSNLDKGQTTTLISAINQNTSAGTLKNMLLNASPLSDAVLLSFINRTNSTPPGTFKDVFIPNSPVSDNVRPALDSKSASLPPGISKQIQDAQSVNPGVRTLTAIARDIIAAENERQLLLNQVVSYYVQADSLALALNLLEQESATEIKQGLVATYLSQGNLSAATLKLFTLPSNTTDDAAFVQLYTLYLNLAVQNKTYWDIDSVQIQQIRDIANMCPASVATVNAQAVLRMLFEEIIAPCIETPTAKMASNHQNEAFHNKVIASSIYLGWKIYPNPNNGKMQMQYSLAQDERGELLIYDVTGKLINYTLLAGEDGILQISEPSLNGGVYFYSVRVNGEVVFTDKLVIIK